MSIMIDLPPAMTQEALGYATVRGTTLEKIFLDYLKSELQKLGYEVSITKKKD